MNVRKIVSAEMDQNCYLIEKDGKGFLIDPGMDEEKIKKESADVEITHILLTHCHFDHLYCLNNIRNGKIVAGTKECAVNMISSKVSFCGFECLPAASCDVILEDGTYNFNGIEVKCIKTPGHTDGCVCFLIEGMLFSGDTLFCESIGRTDFPTGSFSEIEKSIKNKIYTLPDETEVYPGHGPKTTVGYEKRFNPFVRE